MLSRFSDYFVVCGLDENSGLEILQWNHLNGGEDYTGSNESLSSSFSPSLVAPLDRSYKPKILSHHPSSVPWNPFDAEAVRNLCLPDGLLFRTQKHPLSSSLHPFVITRENGSRSYGFSLVFWEEVTSPHVTQAIQTLQAMHLTELSSHRSYREKRAQQGRNIRKMQKMNNAQATLHRRRRRGSRDVLGEGEDHGDLDGDDDTNTRSLPRHFKLNKGGTASLQSFYDGTKDTLYVTKAIALITPLPFVQGTHHFLTGLYKYTQQSEDSSFSIESFIYHLLYHVPLPPPSRAVKLSYWDELLTCYHPSSEGGELPLLDYFFGDVFKILDLPQFLQLFTCVLLENQVLLYSKSLYRLMLVAETVTSVLFPFIWQHVYVPILPSTLHHFLDAPVPFIMGLHKKEGTADPLDFPSCEANLCFVDIDGNRVTAPEDLPTFPHRDDLIGELEEVLKRYNVPVKMRMRGGGGVTDQHNWNNYNSSNNNRTLTRSRNNRNNLSQHSSPCRVRRSRKNSWTRTTSRDNDSDSGMDSNDEAVMMMTASYHEGYGGQVEAQNNLHSTNQPPPSVGDPSNMGDNCYGVIATPEGEKMDEIYLKNLKLNAAIREIFANRFVHIFSSYDHFLSNEDGSHMFVHNFDKATFLSDQPDQDLPFLSMFIETQMFASLIDRKLNQEEEEPNLQAFEQRIKVLRDQFGESLVRTPSYEPCPSIPDSEKVLDHRWVQSDFIVPPVTEILADGDEKPPKPKGKGAFPTLNSKFLNCGPTDTRNLKLLRGNSENDQENHHHVGEGTNNTSSSSSGLRTVVQLKQNTSSPASIAQANWEFIKQLLQPEHNLLLHPTIRLELLKECKTKTKRMLVEKMGPEAVALGHGEVSILGVEENTLVASLCDLLERIWAHGLHVKGKGRSPLWNYLINYQESEACKDSSKPIDPQFLTPDLSLMASELNLNMTATGGGSASPTPSTPTTPINSTTNLSTPSNPKSPERSSRGRSGRSGMELPVITPLPVSIGFDMRNVQSISEIKTEIGYARAWIRLSLEKKVLSKHLRALLADDELLRGLYKRTAFLRSEEEREQFLYHLLTLNAADYFCFTNSYLNIVLPYRVMIFPSRRGFGLSTTTANVWISVSGTVGETSGIQVPKNTLEFVFQHKNLGLLTNMHIGHDNSGPSPKWSVEYVVVRNEVTGHMNKFPCHRWLGKEVDDGSTERLLVGESFSEPDPEGGGRGGLLGGSLSVSGDPSSRTNSLKRGAGRLGLVNLSGDGSNSSSSTSLSGGGGIGGRARSPSVPRASSSPLTPQEIQENLGNAVNAIVKYFFKTDRERGNVSLTVLLCGENGLVMSLEQVFNYGFKSQRLWGKNVFLWDYFVQVGQLFAQRLKTARSRIQRRGRTPRRRRMKEEDPGDAEGEEDEAEEEEDPEILALYCQLIYKINTQAHTLGKNGKFQLFICLAAREHLLPRLPPLLEHLPVTRGMYEDHSFVRDRDLMGNLVQVLLALDDYEIVLEQSLSKGIE